VRGIFAIASNISTPLALAGFFAATLFFILWRLISKGIIVSISRSASGRAVELILMYLFVLSLVAMILGFVGFIVVHATPAQGRSPDSETVNIPPGLTLGTSIKMLTDMDDAVVSFEPSCTKSIQDQPVASGPLSAKTTVALIEQLGYRLESRREISLRARKDPERGVYDISCAK
jgi:hypothetical protein